MPGQSFKYGLPSHFQGNWQNGNREGANDNKAANNNKAPPPKKNNDSNQPGLCSVLHYFYGSLF